MSNATTAQRRCEIGSCDKPLLARGMCSKHYWRWQKYGDANAAVTMREDGTGGINRDGYVRITNGNVAKMQHVLIAEKALGRPLPKGAIVHHANKNPGDNSSSNLVICPNEKYHRLLHSRINAQEACGNADWRKCTYCKGYDDPARMTIDSKYGRAWHAACANAANKAARKRAKDHV